MQPSAPVGMVSGQPVNPTPIMKRKISVGLRGQLAKKGLINGPASINPST